MTSQSIKNRIVAMIFDNIFGNNFILAIFVPKRKIPESRLFQGFLAEKVGFEPTCPCGQLHFESLTKSGI